MLLAASGIWGNGSGIDRMSRLTQSLDHLDVALQRLEQAIDSRERHALADRSQLESELSALRAAHTALQGEARSVYSRIDQIIARLKAAAEV
jgi:predicted  nucleic acid-binding Zn-ribbon protein